MKSYLKISRSLGDIVYRVINGVVEYTFYKDSWNSSAYTWNEITREFQDKSTSRFMTEDEYFGELVMRELVN